MPEQSNILPKIHQLLRWVEADMDELLNWVLMQPGFAHGFFRDVIVSFWDVYFWSWWRNKFVSRRKCAALFVSQPLLVRGISCETSWQRRNLRISHEHISIVVLQVDRPHFCSLLHLEEILQFLGWLELIIVFKPDIELLDQLRLVLSGRRNSQVALLLDRQHLGWLDLQVQVYLASFFYNWALLLREILHWQTFLVLQGQTLLVYLRILVGVAMLWQLVLDPAPLVVVYSQVALFVFLRQVW